MDDTRCNCETSYCTHSQQDTRCSNSADSGTYTMMYVGRICDDCAAVIVQHGGGLYLTRLAATQ